MKRWQRWTIGVFGAVLVGFVALVLALRMDLIGPPKVPQEAIESSVRHDPASMARAWSLPVASTYAKPIYFQSHGSFCGPASLVNVFRSLGGDFTDESAVLDGTGKCVLGFCWMGLSLDALAAIARTHEAYQVEIFRNLTYDQFVEHLRLSNDPQYRYIVNFTRKKIFDHGGGHHSPIGGYLEDDDLVLVLDVNADFQPWLIESKRLFVAMDTAPKNKKRGLLRISRRTP